MRRGYKSQHFKKIYKINSQITAPSVRVLDQTGKQVAILEREKALGLAQEKSVDLVEIAPHANPPVAKLIEYSKFLYQQKKKKQEEKRGQKGSETKEIRLGPFISPHDLEIKLRKAREFVMQGDKVRFVVKFAGRAITKQDVGRDLLENVSTQIADVAKREREARMEGRRMVMVMSKLK